MNAEKLLNEKKFVGGWTLKGMYMWMRTVQGGLKNRKLPLGKRLWCLSKGFSPSVMLTFGEEELKAHYKDYLSDKQYYKIHPINGYHTVWIDDKMTMKNCFARYDAYLPKYYFEIHRNRILRLSDCQREYPLSAEGIVQCLDDVKKLAVKKTIGSGGVGFYRLTVEDGKYFISGKSAQRDEVVQLIASLSGYLVMELLENEKSIREIFPGALNTMRLLWACVDGEYILMRSFLRVGNAKSNGVDNARMGGIEMVIDEETGKVLFTIHVGPKGITKLDTHPDTGVPFLKEIPQWDESVALTLKVMKDYPQMKYMGFDIAITDEGPRIIEINSLSGLTAAQAKQPLLADPKTRAIYQHFGLKIK